MSTKNAVHRSQQWGTVVLLVSAVAVKLIGALFKIPLASRAVLGEVGFGYFSSAYDLFSPLYSLAMTGLPVAVSKTVADYISGGHRDSARNAYAAARKGYFFAGLIGTAAFALLVIPFVRFTGASANTALALFCAAPAVLFSCTLSAGRGYYEGTGNMYPTAISELIEAVCKLALGLGAACTVMRITNNAAYGAAAAIAGISAGVLAATVFTDCYAHRHKDIKCYASAATAEPGGMKRCLCTALLTGPVALTSAIPPLIDSFTVKNGLAALIENGVDLLAGVNLKFEAQSSELLPVVLYGIRGKAYTVFNLVPAITAVIGVAAVPAVAEALKANADSLKGVINTALKYAALISFPAACGFIALGDGLMSLLYDTEASAAIGGKLLSIYGTAAFFAGFLMPLAGILQAAGKQKTVLFNTACGAVAGFFANFMLLKLPAVNIAAAPCGAAVCFFVIFLLDIISLKKTVGFLPSFKSVFAKPLLCAVFCGVVARLTTCMGNSNFAIVAAVLCGGAVYLIALCLCGALEKSDFPPEIRKTGFVKFCEKHRIIR